MAGDERGHTQIRQGSHEKAQEAQAEMKFGFLCFLRLFVANVCLHLYPRSSAANSLRAPAAANRPAHLARHKFGLGKDSEEIPAENLVNVRFAVAAL